MSATTAEMVLDCERCFCHYVAIRRPGDRCGDLSWVPHVARQLTLRAHRRLMCRGRVWPADSGRPHWSRDQLVGWQRTQVDLVIGVKRP